MSSPADRNLLFGILALQMDFITRDQLIDAMHAWVLDKARPLALILREGGALAAADQELLDPLVGRHIARHGNEPEKSLAALPAINSVHDGLKALADPTVQACLSRVSTLQPAGGVPPPPDWPTPGPSRYRIVKAHAKGGLGEVFVARDEELHREVALKQIRELLADDPDSRARFVREAEVTGGLEHPGIVPVYGLGAYSDGRPYYAMRFIK